MYQDVLKFWFEEIETVQWFKKDDAFDQLLIDRFSDIHSQAVQCELYGWRENARGRLAEIIVLDQFSRNMFRGTGQSFANDSLALVLAQEAVSQGADTEVSQVERGFFYLPFMHSESLVIHKEAERIYRQEGMESGLEWELKHKRIIKRFGRYPHRNEVLGRQSTEEELAFLQEPNSSF